MKNKLVLLKIFVAVIVMIMSLTNCKSSKKLANNSTAAAEDFDTFYDRFHKDSKFQFSRLKMPLEGKMADGKTEKKWTKSIWTPMKVKIFDIDTNIYKVKHHKTDKSFTQKFWLEDSGFFSEYRFELIDKLWYLVYAMEVSI
ncbi:MAG: hypothetical protein H7X99_04970 [Saprospiraceae bacterium]|nr:hypothetical protein [Saprospiraceae bacterium]